MPFDGDGVGIEILGNALAKRANRSIASAAVALRAACYQVGGLVASTVAVGLQVVQAELGAVLDGRTAIHAGQAVAKVDGQSRALTNPVHALPIGFSVCCFAVHNINITRLS